MGPEPDRALADALPPPLGDVEGQWAAWVAVAPLEPVPMPRLLTRAGGWGL